MRFHCHSVVLVGGHRQPKFMQDEFDSCGEFFERHRRAAPFGAEIMERGKRRLPDGLGVEMHGRVSENFDVHRAR